MKTTLTVGVFLLTGYLVTWKTLFFSVSEIPKEEAPHFISRNVSGSNSLGANNISATCPSSSRFSLYGTPEHAKMCRWAYPTHTIKEERNCTLLVRPRPSETQGISQWMLDTVTFHLYALQTNCQLQFDYGPGVDVTKILTPHESSWNWTVPSDYECAPPHCHLLQSHDSLQQALNRSLAKVPNYRYAYSSDKYGGIKLLEHEFQELEHALLPGFEVETGVYCSLATLFSLNTVGMQEIVPELCTTLLPSLKQSNTTTVMALYIRTHNADIMDNQERAKQRGEKLPFRQLNESRYMNRVTSIIDCTLQLEQHQHNTSNTVWIVVTDSPSLKQWISNKYSTSSRTIVTTSSSGRHSRPSRTPSITDIAEAFMDWYLIGESDLIISDQESPTFGGTSALRTARPLYNAETCTKQLLVHNNATNAGMENKSTRRKHPARQY